MHPHRGDATPKCSSPLTEMDSLTHVTGQLLEVLNKLDETDG